MRLSYSLCVRLAPTKASSMDLTTQPIVSAHNTMRPITLSFSLLKAGCNQAYHWNLTTSPIFRNKPNKVFVLTASSYMPPKRAKTQNSDQLGLLRLPFNTRQKRQPESRIRHAFLTTSDFQQYEAWKYGVVLCRYRRIITLNS